MGIFPAVFKSSRMETVSLFKLKEKAVISLSEFDRVRGPDAALPGVSIHFNRGLEQAARNASITGKAVYLFIQVPFYRKFFIRSGV
jgi:hypothetical protein